MAFFRSFLIKNGQEPDPAFNEQDEAALVMFLLRARSRHSALDLNVPADFKPPDQLSMEFAEHELKFVAGFLCFFVSKPMQYVREIRAFRDYFIPGFAHDSAKQVQLGQALHEKFFTATLKDLEGAATLDLFFDVNQLFVSA